MQEVLRQGMLVRLAATIRPPRSGARATGRPWPCSGRCGTWRATNA